MSLVTNLERSPSFCHNSFANLIQLDGNNSLLDSSLETTTNAAIPVHITPAYQRVKSESEKRSKCLVSIRRNNLLIESIKLPIIMNINPRSVYNKTDDFKLLLDQYEADIVCMSESWERDNYSLEDLLQLDTYTIVTNEVHRETSGGKPAILIKKEKFHVKPLCPNPITVPIGVECVWALVSPRHANSRSKVQHIAVASIYFNGPKSNSKRNELYDHIAETYHYILSKYSSQVHFLICGDTNRLNLKPILSLSPNLKQAVKVYTRLNPPAILDPIITTLGKWYKDPVSMPPVDANPGAGKPSDHLVILMSPLASEMQIQPRVYRSVTTRPLTRLGLEKFAEWIESYDWSILYNCQEPNEMACILQEILVENYYRCFPAKVIKVCSEDKPWITAEVKNLNRKMKREFTKNKKSKKWVRLKEAYEAKCQIAKERYYSNIVEDLKLSNPSKWYSKVKHMAGKGQDKEDQILVDELIGYSNKEQAELIASHYTEISNSYAPINVSEFSDYLNPNRSQEMPKVEPYQVNSAILKMNRKAATIANDIPMKLICEFSVELATPLAFVINSCINQGVYPSMWKVESVTPVPKVFPPEKIKDLRKISGLYNLAKVMDKILGNYIISDMEATRDVSQYGNQKKLSIQHYLVKMLNRVLTAVDKNSQSEAIAVVANLVDWSKAFDRQCHTLGIKSFIQNGVRPSLIPILISFFEDRKMKVKWNNEFSSEYPMNGGGPQGDVLGILEYLSQTNDNTDFIDLEDKFKFIDDLSFLDIINLIVQGITSYNFKSHVASDVGIHNQFLPSQNSTSQLSLDRINKWTEDHLMKLNSEKSQYMIFNYTENYQFNMRLNIDGQNLEQVSEKKLLGVLINDRLTWDDNTSLITRNAYKRMVILQRVSSFGLEIEELVNIYILYIRSVVENSAVVWHSSLTQANEMAIERVQKVALRIILGEGYENYANALHLTGLKTLSQRRTDLCLNFAKQCIKNPKTQDMFPRNHHVYNTRAPEKFLVQPARTDRLKYSAIPYMQRLLNSQ